MNSSVRISVRATFGDAQKQFASLIAELNRLDVSARTAGEGVGALDKRLESSGVAIGAWGKKLQYASSILTYNFTVPIVGAFGLLVASELKYEKSLASLEQVYKRVGSSVTDFRQNAKNTQADLGALDGIVMTLSSHYGIARNEVANTATELGRAGSAGVSLAKDTESALIAQRAYNLTAEEATGVITTLRASYKLTSDQTRDTLGVLAVSNESTRGSFSLLAQGLIRAAPVATQLGVPIRNLTALLSTMNQAGFKGGESGNALSAGLQRLVVVTPKASDLLKKLGIDAQGSAFQSLNGAQRIELLAQKLKGANGDLIAYAANTIFGVQRSKQFDAVIADLANRTGSYRNILRDTQDTQRTNGFLMQQLGIQLKNPAVALDVLKQQFSNNASVVARDLIPALTGLLRFATLLSSQFAKMSPPVQQFVVFSLVLLALLGPIGKIIGSFGVLAGFLKTAAEKILSFFGITLASTRRAADERLAIEEQNAAEVVAVKMRGAAAAQAVLEAAIATENATRATQAALVEAGLAVQGEVMVEQVLAASAASRAIVAATAAQEELLAAQTELTLVGMGGAAATGFLPILGVIVFLGAVLTAVYAFHDQFLQAFQNIAEGLGYIVAEIYTLLQWINPFARHSPSLVENADNGSERINQAYSRMAKSTTQSMGIVARAQRDLNAALASAGLGGGVSFSIAKGEKAVDKQGIAANITAYKEGEKALGVLNVQLRANQAAQDAQTKKVDASKAAYKAASDAVKDATLVLKGLENQQKALQEAMKKLGDPTALRTQATAASNMGRALLAAGNPQLAAQFGAQADKLNLQSAQAQKAKDAMDALSKEIEAQKDSIENLTTARDALLDTYNAEKDALSAIKQDYTDIKQEITDITGQLQQMASAATAANTAIAKSHPVKGAKGGAGGGKNAGLPGALGSTLMPGGVGGLQNDAGSLNKYLDGLKAQLGNKMGSIFPSPLKAIGDFIGKLKDSFNKGFDEFGKGGFQKAFGFGKDLPGWIKAGLSAGIAGLSLALTGIGLMILRFFLSGQFAVVAFNFGKGLIGSALEGMGVIGLPAKMGALARTGLLAFGRGLIGMGAAVLAAVGSAAGALLGAAPIFLTDAVIAVSGIVTAILALPVELLAAIGIALVALLIALYKWRDPIWNFAKQIPGWIWDAITTAWNTVLDLPTLVLTWIASVTPGVLAAVTSFANKMPGWMWTAFVAAWKGVFFLAGFVLGFLTKATIEIVGGFIKLGIAAVKGIWSGVTSIWDKTVTLVTFIFTWLTKSVPAAGEHFRTFALKLPGYIMTGIKAAWDGAVNLVGYIFTWLTKSVPAAGAHFRTFALALPGYIMTGIKDAWYGALHLPALIGEWLARVLPAIAGSLLQIGGDIVAGIKSGIMSAWSGLVGSVGSLASSLVSGFAKGFGIKSPSTVMARSIGLPLVQGIAVGMQAGAPAMGDAAVASVTSAMDRARAQMLLRSKTMTLPRLTQNIDLKYAGQPLTNLPGGSQANTGTSGGVRGPASGGQTINVSMNAMGESTDPHAVAQALAWRLRMAGA